MGDPNNMSAAEIKLALQRWRTPKHKVDACLEKKDLVALFRAEAQLAEVRRARAAQQQQQQQSSSSYATRPSGGSSSSSSSSPNPLGQVGWQTWLIGGLVLVMVLQRFGIIGDGMGDALGGGASDEVQFDLADTSYAKGKVAEVQTFSQFKSALTLHKDGTGLPVVVDFFSHSCGPCVMIAPTFRRLAKEFKGRAVFLKVDVNRNHETSSACGIRAMPTFQFYSGGKKVAEFSGADGRRLHGVTSELAAKAERRGTFVGVTVTEDSLLAFYKEHDESKLGDVPKVASKYASKTAKLMRLLKKKYKAVPQLSSTEAAEEEEVAAEGGRVGSDGAESQGRSKKEKKKPAREQEPDAEEEDDFYPFVPAVPTGRATKHAPAKVLILGGGPAGLTAAIYAARAGLEPIIVAPQFGGQLLGKGVDVENFPGVVGAQATGRGIVQLMRAQAYEFKTLMIDDVAVQVDVSQGRPFRVQLNASSAPVFAHSVVIATGADSRWLGVPGEHDFRGKGISSCATCDGFLYRGRDVLVVGGGDTAMEDALVLARTSKSVTLVHRRDKFRASHTLAARVKEHAKIKILWNTVVESFGGDSNGDVAYAMLRSTADADSEAQRLAIGAAFVAIGHDPNTEMFKGQLEMDAAGYLETPKGRSTKTSVEGVFAAGDVADHVYRQAVTSAGSGAMAALDAERFLSGLGIAA